MSIRVDPRAHGWHKHGMVRMLPWLLVAVMADSSVGRAGAADGSRVALVLGNSKYESAVGPLRNPVNDARNVSKTLRSLGFLVTEETNATRDEMIEAVAGFRGKIKGAEVAVFYYAGHGVSVGGSNYLIPIKSGYEPGTGDETALRMLAETRLFNVEQIVADMSVAGGRCNVVILDACRNTPVARTPGARDATRGGGLSEMNPPAGSIIAFATDAGRTAEDGTGDQGLYTGELVRHLATPGLTVEQVFKRTRAGVMEKSGGAQIPAEYSRLVGDDIYLAGRVMEEPTPRAVAVEPPGTSAINRLAAAGQLKECADALHLNAAAKGKGDYAAAPLDTLLELAKEEIEAAQGPSPQVRSAMEACEVVLDAIRDCLPPAHPRYNELTAKANNRLGDCLMLTGKPADALAAYQVAVRLAPTDAYPLYNRGRALLALGETEAAKADFTAVIGPSFQQPKARTLAREELEKLK